MKTPLVPIALLVALVVSAGSALPLAGTAFLSLSLFGSMLALGSLAWWIIAVAVLADPAERLRRAVERWEDNWDSFEQDFWAHVASVDASRER